MTFHNPFTPTFFVDEVGNPCAMQCRIVFTSKPPWLAIIQLQQDEESFASAVVSASVRDQLLNRVLNNELRGLPLSAVRLVAGDGSGAFEYEMTLDIHDYVQRGNLFKVFIERARRGRFVERIEVAPDSVTTGSARIDTVHASAATLSHPVRVALGLNVPGGRHVAIRAMETHGQDELVALPLFGSPLIAACSWMKQA